MDIQSKPIKLKSQGRITSVFVIILLASALPLSLLIMAIVFLKSQLIKRVERKTIRSERILLSGGKMTKALQLARLFSRAGHTVILAETEKYSASGHAYSNCVKKFYSLPSKEQGFDAYCDKMEEIISAESIDIFVPVASPTSVFQDAKLKTMTKSDCTFFCFDEKNLDILDNKYAVCKTARKIGLSAPEVHYICDRTELCNPDLYSKEKKYILKCLSYDPVGRLNRPLLPFAGQSKYFEELTISKERPWILQEFIEGREYCTHSTVQNGKVLLHCCCYSSDFQLRYHHVDHPPIFEWVVSFVRELNLTGQISFDFIENEAGVIFPIECNPRTHSAITCFYNFPRAVEAFLPTQTLTDEKVIMPRSNAKETYWLYYELWKLFTSKSLSKILSQVQLFLRGKEAILDEKDLLPFLIVYHWQIPALLMKAVWAGKPWVRIDFNIGKLVEAGGD